MKISRDRTFFRRTNSIIVDETDSGSYTVTTMQRNDGRDSLSLFTDNRHGHANAYFHFLDEVEVQSDDDCVSIEVTGPNRGAVRITLFGITLEQLARAVNAEQFHQSELALDAALDKMTQ